MRASRAYIAGLGTSGSLVLGAAMLFVLGSAVVAFNGWPKLGPAAPPATRQISVRGATGQRAALGLPAVAIVTPSRSAPATAGRGPSPSAPSRRGGHTQTGRLGATRAGSPVPSAPTGPGSGATSAGGSGSGSGSGSGGPGSGGGSAGTGSGGAGSGGTGSGGAGGTVSTIVSKVTSSSGTVVTKVTGTAGSAVSSTGATGAARGTVDAVGKTVSGLLGGQ